MSKVGPAYKDSGLDASPLVDSGINKQLIKQHSLVLSASVSYFVVCCFYHKICNTTKVLNHMAPTLC